VIRSWDKEEQAAEETVGSLAMEQSGGEEGRRTDMTARW
jgi:hypothetical protein